MFGKRVQNIQKESFYVVFFPLSKLSHHFVSGNRVLFPHFNRGKTCFSRKIPQKVQLTKHLFFTWVSRNIFHLKHFFLDFYFHFFVFFLRSKTFFRVELSGGTTVFFPLGFTQSIKKIQFQEKTFNHLLCEKSFGR